MTTYKKPKGSIKISKGLDKWVQQLAASIKTHTDWKTGYTCTETGGKTCHAVMQRQLQKNPAGYKKLVTELIEFRAFTEDCLCYQYQLDKDGIRESHKVPDWLRHELGVLDSLIAGAMMVGLPA